LARAEERAIETTGELANTVLSVLPRRIAREQGSAVVRRVFQALRIHVNDEFGALENLLRVAPQCLAPHGKVAILTFHSGEDRRVKKSFQEGARAGIYAEVADEPARADAAEVRANPRAASAKLRWARRA